MKTSQISSTSMKLINTQHQFIFGLLLFCISVSFAQKKESLSALETDRSDVTEASNSIQKRGLQIKTNAFLETFQSNQMKTKSLRWENLLLSRRGIFLISINRI